MHIVVFTEYRLMLMEVSNGKCNICGQNNEVLKHLFWECQTVKYILVDVSQLSVSLHPENIFF